MSDKEKEILDEDADVIVEMTDEEGNSYYYREEMIIPVGDDKFALLIGIHDEEEEEEHAHSCGCGCGEHDEDVLIAKVVMGDDGEEEYVEPTDEEFDAVQRAYDALMDDEEED
ncbi:MULTISPECIES: DUF1292 domain-containing protein [Selenomonas]|jgi:hypothetical protein|uniref:DUF1292 domain-containing protein n=1 Tax=Selenomonas TaxID=970 RepID=UPI00027C3C90|nr:MULTISPECIES: DUF1292 domain-containing protein [Selenomonas]EJU28136.1 PF06949 family protein [Selenomonas sp. CM52]UZE46158.1 DUF1292 domain-containing protein [Selenomonas sputigena]